jgi:hypothetical protein
MTAHLMADERGTLKEDAFYLLETSGRFNDPLFRPYQWYRNNEKTILRDRESKLRLPGQEIDWMRVENLSGFADKEFHECTLDRTHITRQLWTTCTADFYGGQEASQLVPGILGDFFFMVMKSLADALKASPFRGIDLRPIEIATNQSELPDPEIFAWQFTGRNCRRAAKIVGGKNKCPFCGQVPLVCDSCGESVNHPCTSCKNYTMCSHDDMHADERRIRVDSDRPDLLMILEGSRWDGADCVASRSGNYASRRLVDWLVKRNATPFVAVPVRFCTDGMNDRQKRWLEEVATPL